MNMAVERNNGRNMAVQIEANITIWIPYFGSRNANRKENLARVAIKIGELDTGD